MNIKIRPMKQEDVETCGRICYRLYTFGGLGGGFVPVNSDVRGREYCFTSPPRMFLIKA